MNIGSAWAKTEEKDGKKVVASISVSIDKAILELYPQLKNLRFGLKPIPQEQRGNENSPHYRAFVYKPEEQTSAQTSEVIGDDEIPY